MPPIVLMIEKDCGAEDGKFSVSEAHRAGECNCITATVKKSVEEYHALIEDFKAKRVEDLLLNNGPAGISFCENKIERSGMMEEEVCVTVMNENGSEVVASKKTVVVSLSGPAFCLVSTSLVFLFGIIIGK